MISPVPTKLLVEDTLLEKAADLMQQYFSAEPEVAGTERAVERCAMLAASRIMDSPLTLSQVAKDESEMHSTVLHLKHFLDKVPLRDDIKRDLSSIKASFTFSLTFYKKLEELWERLGLLDSPQLKQLTWLVFILAKSQLMRANTNIIETAFMLIGVLHTVLLKLPVNSLSPAAGKNSHEIMKLLCDLMKTQVKFAQPFAEKAAGLMRSLEERKVVKEGELLEGTLEGSCRLVGELYEGCGVDIDEREFVGRSKGSRRQRTPMTPFTRQIDGSRRINSHHIPGWESDTSSLSLHSKLHDLRAYQSSSPVPQPTPMSQAMELNTWLVTLLEPIESVSIPDSIQRYCSRCILSPETEILNRIYHFRMTLEGCMQVHRLEGKAKTDTILRLYLRLLDLLLSSEDRRNSSADFSIILHSDAFHRSIFAACLEIHCFIYNISKLSFEDVLSTAGISGFEFWKLISSLCSCDVTMPTALRTHLRLIEIRIVQKLGWMRGSPVHQAIRYVTRKEAEDREPLHVTYDLFFKRVLAYSASRLLSLTEALFLPSSLSEDIWTALKFFLSNKTELLIDRHMDQLILCVIFGICKVKSHPLKFTTIVDQYGLINEEEKHAVCRQVPLDSSEGSIIDFYNQVMVMHVRDYARVGAPEVMRISALAPDCKLRVTATAQLQKLLQSPQSTRSKALLTPKTLLLCATPESPVTRASDKRLDFDSEEKKYEPTKKPRHLEEILQPCRAQLRLPFLKKDN